MRKCPSICTNHLMEVADILALASSHKTSCQTGKKEPSVLSQSGQAKLVLSVLTPLDVEIASTLAQVRFQKMLLEECD